MPTSDFDRERELDAIRAQYADYEHAGRYDLWTLSNPGFERLVREKDAHLMRLLRASVADDSGPILDLGAGSGRLAGVAQAAGLHQPWIGVELDPVAVAEARRAYPWAEFAEASADRLPMGDASVSAAVASVLFSSLPSVAFERAVAREIERVLRPGGWLVWYDLRYDNPRNRGVHGLGLRAIRRVFPGWDLELTPISLLPPLARRLGRSTPFAYLALHAITPLRSHLIGRMRPG